MPETPADLPPGWARYEVEPIAPGRRRTADELMVARGRLTRTVVAKRVLDLPPGSRIRRRLLVSAIRGAFGLLARRDYKGMLRGYDEDCEIVFEDMPDAGPEGLRRGHGAVEDWLRSLEDAGEVAFRPEEIVDPGGPTFAGRIETTIVGRGSGIELDFQQGFLWTIHDVGLVTRQHIFRDWAPALAELKRIVAAPI